MNAQINLTDLQYLEAIETLEEATTREIMLNTRFGISGVREKLPQMKKRGLVEVERRGPSTGRPKVWKLTPKGRVIYEDSAECK